MSEERVNLIGGGDGPVPVALDLLPPPVRRVVQRESSDDPFSGDVPMSIRTVPLQQQPQPRQSGKPSSREPTRSYRTLEEMYAAHRHDLMSDGRRLRIQRTGPRRWTDANGQIVNTSGIIGFEKNPMSTEEFAQKYGGRNYRVYLQVPDSGEEDSFGFPGMIDKAVAEFEIPIEPNLFVLPIADSQDMYTGQAMTQGSPYGRQFQRQQQPVYEQRTSEDGGVVRTVLDFAARQQAGNQSGASPEAFRAIQETGQAAIHNATQMAQTQIQMVQQQLEQSRAEAAELRRMVLDKQREPTDVVQMMQAVAAINQSTRTSASSEELQVIRNQHRDEMERIHKFHQDELINRDRIHTEQLRMAQANFEERLRSIEQRMKDLSEEHLRREQSIKDEMDRRERELKRDGESKLQMLQMQYETRVKDMEQNHDRELRNIERMHGATSRTEEKANEMKLAVAQQEIARMAAELSSKNSELADLRAKTNKPFLEQVHEIRELGAVLSSAAGGDETPPEKEPFIERLATSLAPAAPQLLQALGNIVRPNSAAQQAAPAQPAAPVQHAQLPQAQARPQPQAQRRQPPRMVFQEEGGPRVSPRAPGQEVRQNNSTLTTSSQIVQSPQQQPQQQVYTAPTQPAPQQVPVQVQQPEPAPAPAAAQPEDIWAGMEWTMMNPDQLVSLFGFLEGNMTSSKTPEETAAELTKAYGVETIQLVAQFVEIEKLIQSIDTAPATKSTALATKRGRGFMRGVWKELGNIAASAAQSGV